MLAHTAERMGFMDLCAGSGIMGFEAAGMGFDPVWMIESDRATFEDLEANKDALACSVTLIRGSVFHLERHRPPEAQWVFYADPPFSDKRFQARLLEQLGAAAWVRPGSLYVAETEGRALVPSEGWQTLKEKKYGRIFISLLEKQEPVTS